MKDNRNKGRCRRCAHSLKRKYARDSVTDKRIHQYCFHYNSWCNLVSRNCFAAFSEISPLARKRRDIEEREMFIRLRKAEDGGIIGDME